MVFVRLRNYSLQRRNILQTLMKLLIETVHSDSHPTSRLACTPMSVAKPGLAIFRFTVDLRPVNKYTIKY